MDRSKKVLLSVVVCAYNEEVHLSSCLESLTGQKTQFSYEVIVIDDGSTDQTQTIAMDWAQQSRAQSIRYFRIVHSGLSVARNTGLDRSRGQLVAFIDADAHADPMWVEKIVEPFLDPAVDVVAGRVSNLNDRERFARFIHKVHFEAALRASKGSRITGANMAFRKNIFDLEGIGFFDYFDRRGDETSMRVRYFGRNPASKEVNAPDAVVLNEHPDRFFSWLCQQSYDGALTAIIEYCVDEHIKRTEIIAKLIMRCCAVAALPIVVLASHDLPLLAISAFAFWMARIAYRSRYILESMRGGADAEGALGAIAGLGASLAGTTARDIGYVRAVPPLLIGEQIDLDQSIGTVVASWDNAMLGAADRGRELGADGVSSNGSPE